MNRHEARAIEKLKRKAMHNMENFMNELTTYLVESSSPSKSLMKENNSLNAKVADLEAKIKSMSSRMNSMNAQAPFRMLTHTKQSVLDALVKHDGVRELAAKELGMHINTIYPAIRKFGIQYPAKRRKKVVKGKVLWIKKDQ